MRTVGADEEDSVTSEQARPAPSPAADGAGGSPPTGALRAFLAAAARNPAQIGAIAPSSPRLAAQLASVVPTDGTPTVVELGPGTGSVSAVIDGRLPEGSRHLAVELDPRLADYLRRAHPGMEVVEGDANELTALLAARSAAPLAAVISGLPWSLFSEESQRGILGQVGAALAPGGAFTTFAYTHTGLMSTARRFRRLLHDTFDEVVISRTVWRNLPPAYAYVCRRPHA